MNITDRTQRYLWLCLVVLFGVGLTIITFSYIVTEPWRMIPDIGGDGIKNDLTYLYHSCYEKGYWFGGLNYPYGEHIVYTDGQPLISVFLANIGNVSMRTALTISWWVMGLSYVLSIVYLYKTLLHFKVGPLAAMIFAGLISIATPQLLNIKGHYALIYGCVVPMAFYWTILYNESSRIRYCIYLFFLGCIMAFLHPYFAGMLLVWVACYAAGYLLFTRVPLKAGIRHVYPILLSVVATLLVVALMMKLTDPIHDRPTTPYDPMDSYTGLRQIFTSAFSPIWQGMADAGVIRYASGGGEGYTYPGIVALIVVPAALACSIVRRVRRKDDVATIAPACSPIWLFIAIAVLVFSTGSLRWLTGHLTFFRQFRALGRFSWISYYVITVYCGVVLYHLYLRLFATRRYAAYALLVGAMAIWAVEANGYVKMTRKVALDAAYNYDVICSTYEKNWPAFLQEHRLDSKDLQAIIALPFFHIGTEKLWVGDPGWHFTLSARAALQLRLPMVNVMLSRSSWSIAQKQLKTFAGPYADKPMLRDLKNDKPLLLLDFDTTLPDPDQKYLLSASEYIGELSSAKVYALYPSRLMANDKKNRAAIDSMLPYVYTGDTCLEDKGPWYIDHFDGQRAGSHFFGTGAAPHIQHDDSIIATIPIHPAKDSQLYECSYWVLLDNKDYRSPELWLQMMDSSGQPIGSVVKVNTNQSMDSHDMWFRASKYLCIPAGCARIQCTVKNMPNPAYHVLDELTLRPADAVIISKSADGHVLVNGHWFK